MAGVPGHDLRTRACALSAPSRPTGRAVTHRRGGFVLAVKAAAADGWLPGDL